MAAVARAAGDWCVALAQVVVLVALDALSRQRRPDIRKRPAYR